MELNEVNLILSAVRALWGAITPSVRAVIVRLEGNTIRWWCVLDGSETEEEVELLRVSATQLWTDFVDTATIEEEYLSIAPPGKIPWLGETIYARAENMSSAVLNTEL